MGAVAVLGGIWEIASRALPRSRLAADRPWRRAGGRVGEREGQRGRTAYRAVPCSRAPSAFSSASAGPSSSSAWARTLKDQCPCRRPQAIVIL